MTKLPDTMQRAVKGFACKNYAQVFRIIILKDRDL
jgi:hypothetical protein